MYCSSKKQMLVVCLAVTALLAMPAESRAGRVWECLFGPAVPSQTTYAPAYVPSYAPTYAAPACQPYAPSCVPCTPCAVQVCQYPAAALPVVVQRPIFGGYRPAGWAPYAATVTTYRPFLGTYQTHLVPYTTYRPLVVPAISYLPVASSYYSPCGSCSPCGGCSLCGGYGSPCAGGACGSAVYSSPSGCSSCGSSVGGQPAASSVPMGSTPAMPQQPAEPKTFKDEKVEKPESGPDLLPIPQADTKLNSTPTPPPSSGKNRLASAGEAVRTAVLPAAWPVPPAADRNDGGWGPARN